MLDAFRYQVFVKMLACVLLTCVGCSKRTTESGVSEAAIVTRTYCIADIIQGDEWTNPVPERIDQWIVCVTANVAPGSWNGKLGTIRADYEQESLVVSHTSEIQEKVAMLLEEIRSMNVE